MTKNNNLCSQKDCTKITYRHTCGFCWDHWVTAIHTGVIKPVQRKKRTGIISYVAAHKRIARERGFARWLTCADCDEQASQWSLIHGSPVLVEPGGSQREYSLDPFDYEPRCTPCHKRYDREWRDHRQTVAEAA